MFSLSRITMTRLTIQRRNKISMMATLVPSLKGKIQIRVIMFAQACLCFALFTVRLTSRGEENQTFLRPTKNEAWRVSQSTFRHHAKVQAPLFLEGARSLTKVMPENVSTATTDPATKSGKHLPDFFTERVPWKSLLARNNIITVYTGCSIAAWTYGWNPTKRTLGKYYDDCGHYSDEKGWKGRDITPETVSSIQPGDSIYVELMKLDDFVDHVLPLIKVDIVLISGQNHFAPMKPPIRPPYGSLTFRSVILNPHVTHWFMMNLDKHSWHPFHPKMHPFPYGLSANAKGGKPPAAFDPEAKDAYVAELHQNRTKENLIFVGYISEKSNPDRALVPKGEKLPSEEYYKTMHESKYILSPDGDRPECYRHYEAIGLGTMPITQLHPHLYRHLAGNVVFNETKWNITELETTLTPKPKVNRRLLYDEYWMEYVERVVGRPMRWWDSSRASRSSLSEITTVAMASILQSTTETI